MTAGEAQVPTMDRLAQLCREYGSDGHTVVVPLTRAELADRWGVSRGTVQRYLSRRVASGEVVTTAPLTLNAEVIGTPGRPQLRLLVNRPHSHGRDPAPDVEAPPGMSYLRGEWLQSIQNALNAAAEAGRTETTLALEARLFERLALLEIDHVGSPTAHRSDSATDAEFSRDRCAISRDTPIARSPSDQELEGTIRSNSADRGVARTGRASIAQQAREALESGNVPEDAIAVVVRRLEKGELRGTGATPAWMRDSSWQAPAWLPEDVVELDRCWTDAFDRPLSGDPLLALQLWTPDEAKTAIEILQEDRNVRSPLGRILEAAVWGYHKHFPPFGPSLEAAPDSAKRLWELAESERRFFGSDPELVAEHLRTLADHPNVSDEELLSILGIHALNRTLPVAALEALDVHRWSAAEISEAADRVDRVLGGHAS